MKLTRGTPGAAGISPRAILNFVNALEEDNLGVQSFMLYRRGIVAAEAWWKPYSPDKTHMLFSLSKSFTSTAVGFAVEEGKIGLDDSVLEWFRDDYALTPCENMKKMKVRHLLMMGTGHDKEPDVFSAPDWAYAFLTGYVKNEPGSLFVYNTPATYMLSCIVQKATGQKVIDYLTPRLFEPLGIRDISWDESPQGVNTGGFGLNVRTEDILRFGRFLLSRGNVDGVQLINPSWIDLATSVQISNGDPAQANDWSMGYGFQFWRCQPKGVYRGDGAFGQYCIVMPDEDACLAVTSGSGDMGRIMHHVWTKLIPAMGDECEDDGLDELKTRLSSLAVPFPEGEKAIPDFWPRAARYEFGLSSAGFNDVSFDFTGETPKMRLSRRGAENEDYDACLGFGRWMESGEGMSAVSSAYAVLPDGRLHVRTVVNRTPFVGDFFVRFDGHAIDMTVRQNVGMDEPEIRLIGMEARA